MSRLLIYARNKTSLSGAFDMSAVTALRPTERGYDLVDSLPAV